MEPLLLVTVPKGKIDPIVKKDEKIEFAEVKVVSKSFSKTSSSFGVNTDSRSFLDEELTPEMKKDL